MASQKPTRPRRGLFALLGPKPLRAIKIGHVTLYEGLNGRWNSGSFARSDALERRIKDQITGTEYAAEIRSQVAEARLAHSLMGERVCRRHFRRFEAVPYSR